MPDIPAPIEPETNSQNGKHRPPEPVVEMKIVLMNDGNVQVSGPLSDFRLTARMLAQALVAATNFAEQKRERLLEPVSADALRMLRRT